MTEFISNYILAAQTIALGDYILELGITTWWVPYLYETFKYTLILLSVVYFIAIVMILMRSEGGFKIRIKEAIEEAMEAGKLPKTKIQRKWDSIVEDSESDNIEKNHNAALAAEKLLDDTFKAANISGENLESRIRKIPEAQLSFKDEIVWVHNLAKKIRSERAGEVEKEEVQRAVSIVQRTMKDLDII